MRSPPGPVVQYSRRSSALPREFESAIAASSSTRRPSWRSCLGCRQNTLARRFRSRGARLERVAPRDPFAWSRQRRSKRIGDRACAACGANRDCSHLRSPGCSFPIHAEHACTELRLPHGAPGWLAPRPAHRRSARHGSWHSLPPDHIAANSTERPTASGRSLRCSTRRASWAALQACTCKRPSFGTLPSNDGSRSAAA